MAHSGTNVNTELDLDDYFETGLERKEKSKILIQLFQINSRKTTTTITGMDTDLDFHRILKEMKRKFACNGHIVNDDKYGTIIQLQGDHRHEAVEWIYKHKIADPDEGRVVVMGA